MATKSKNMNKNAVKRLIALAAALVFFFFASLEFCYNLRDTFYYNRSDITGQYPLFYLTNTFRENLNDCEYALLEEGEYRTCESEEDYEKTSEGKANKRSIEEGSASIREACDYLDSVDSLEINVHNGNLYRYHYVNEDGANFYFDYEGNFISKDSYYFHDLSEEEYEEEISQYYTEPYSEPSTEENADITMTTAPAKDKADVSDEADISATETTTMVDSSRKPDETKAVTRFGGPEQNSVSEYIRLIWNLTYNPDQGTGINYGEMDTEEIIEVYKELNEGVSHYGYDRDDYIESFENIPGLKYAVFYNTTGKVYTNCGVQTDDNTEAVLKKLDCLFYEYTDGKEYVTSHDGSGVYSNVIFRSAAGDISSPLSFMPDRDIYTCVDRAYFGFTDTNTGPFSVGEKAYYSVATRGNHSQKLQLALTIISFILGIAALVYYFIKCGVNDEGEVRIRFTDKIPLLIRMAFSFGIICLLGALVFGIHYYEFMFVKLFTYNAFPYSMAYAVANSTSEICAFIVVICLLLLVGLIAGCIRNIRNKTFFRHTLLYSAFRLFRAIWRRIKKIHYRIKDRVTRLYSEDYTNKKGRKFLIFSAVAIVVFELVSLIVLSASDAHGGVLFFGVVFALLVGAYAALLALSFHRIASGVSKIKEGKFDTVIATRLMPPYMRATAQDITCVRDGIQSAVNQALKDQTMKTELITNVTHDLKTPLTSIITYVDLLEKEGLESENAGEYLKVIDEKSQKLKTLINDLVQASKASSGAMEVHCTTLDLCEFAVQIAGEYKEELEKSGIMMVVNCPETPVLVSADPALVSRVFENLIGNIKKYAMQGTRAFLTVSSDGRFGTIVFKNISAAPLNIDSRKLTERFYRGDSSRTGEGSGLGLSIAKDLCALQGGQFRIELDGDMFKVYVSLAAADTGFVKAE